MTGLPDEAALAAHARAGVVLVVDLRTPGEGVAEEAVAAARLGMNYVSLPVGREAASEAVVARFGELAAAAGGTVLLHCGSGNRAGEVLARHLLRQGVPREEALERGREAGLAPAREVFVP